jgi:hypothetical protein
VLQGLPRKLALDAADLSLVVRRLGVLAAEVELELGKRALRCGDFEAARVHLSRTTPLRNWKARAARVAMRFVPPMLLRRMAPAAITRGAIS